ncbi:MAG: hypothetical protein FWD34_01320 [Oscillospiraceae bacterium]|nr:hypothetical protein [Oscillospiraceae bacterium]
MGIFKEFEEKEVETQRYHVEKDIHEEQFVPAFTMHSDIMDSKKSSIFLSKKDSSEFKAVKEGVQELFHRTNSTLEDVSLMDIKASYIKVIDSCDEYLAKKDSKWKYSRVGEERVRMVKALRESALYENSIVSETHAKAVEMLNKNEYYWRDGKPSLKALHWHFVVHMMRTETIEVKEEESSKAGAGTSDVLVIGNEVGKRQFFKETEVLRTAADEVPEIVNKKLGEIEKTDTFFIFENGFEAFKELFKDAEFRSYFDGLAGSFAFRPDMKDLTDNKIKEEIHAVFNAITLDEIMYGKETVNNFEAALENTDFCKAMYSIMKPIARNLARETACENAGIKVGSVLSTRNVATSRMADILGAGDLIARSRVVDVKQGTKTRRGIVMQEAIGKEILLHSEEEQNVIRKSPDFMRERSRLFIMDYICSQTDRHDYNFFVNLKKEGNKDTVKITGIDNDMAFGTITKGFGVSSEANLFDENGKLKLPYLDVKTASSIMALTPEIIAHNFCDLLSADELSALMKRVKKIFNAVQTFAKETPHKILSPGDWDNIPGIAEEFRKANLGLAFM